MKFSKIIGLRTENLDMRQVRALLTELASEGNWLHAYIEIGMNDFLFYPCTVDLADEWLAEQGHWCFDYEPHYKFTLMISNDEEAVFWKLRCLDLETF